jgi:hypothetical protein
MEGTWREAHRAENDALMAQDTFEGLLRLLRRYGAWADRDMAAELPGSTAPSCILRALWRALVMRQRALRSNRRGTRPGARHDLCPRV